MQGVSGSNPLTSTTVNCSGSPSSRGLGHNPFTVGTGVRIPVGTPLNLATIWLLFLFLRSEKPFFAEFQRLFLISISDRLVAEVLMCLF